MSATIRFADGVEATVTDTVWSSDNADLAAILQTVRPPWDYTPNRDLTAALAAVRQLGGRLLRFDPVVGEPGRIY